MKKRMLSLLAACLLLCSSCGAEPEQTESAAPSGTGLAAASWTPAEEWPVNACTEGVPVPPGEVTDTLIEESGGFCAVSLDGVSSGEAEAWRGELAEAGFRRLAGVEEEVKGTVPSGTVSIGEVYTDGSVYLSVSHTDEWMVVYCAPAEA